MSLLFSVLIKDGNTSNVSLILVFVFYSFISDNLYLSSFTNYIEYLRRLDLGTDEDYEIKYRGRGQIV